VSGSAPMPGDHQRQHTRRTGGRLAYSTASLLLTGLLVAGSAARPAQAEEPEWPTRPVTLVVPFSAGEASDAIGRIIADGIGTSLRQTVVVENVTGTGGLLGGAKVARATPDGYQFV